MLKSRKELAAGKSKIKEAISMNFRGDKKEYQELAESKEFQHMIDDNMIIFVNCVYDLIKLYDGKTLNTVRPPFILYSTYDTK